MKPPGTHPMHETQSVVAEWLLQQVPLLVPARESAVAVGGAGPALSGDDLETAHVVWCAGDARWRVATYWPDWYADAGVSVIAL